MAPPATATLDVRSLSKSFGSRRVFTDVSFTVKPGELVVILGPSGSGKTTLFRCVTRLIEPDAGQVLLDGRPLMGLKGTALANERRKIGLVFQQFNLVKRLSAIDNVLAARLVDTPWWRVLLRRFRSADEAAAIEALIAVGLGGYIDQRADRLSGGQQQRVAIARSLLQQSRLLLADEPVASLDPETAEAILSLLHDLTRSVGLSVLCSLHQPKLAERFADRVLVMRDGRLSEAVGAAAPVAGGDI